MRCLLLSEHATKVEDRLAPEADRVGLINYLAFIVHLRSFIHALLHEVVHSLSLNLLGSCRGEITASGRRLDLGFGLFPL